MGFVAHDKMAGRWAGDRVRAVIVGEFSKRNLLDPRRRVCSTKDAEIGFDFLIDSFGFSVGLRVVGGGEGEIVVKEFF